MSDSETAAITADRVLYVADVAARRRISLRATRAWLVSLEKRYGRDVVQRIGRRLCTTERALRSVLPGGELAAGPARRFASLAEQVRRQNHQIRAQAAAIHDLRARCDELEALRGRVDALAARLAGH
jgi:hypothetical protein